MTQLTPAQDYELRDLIERVDQANDLRFELADVGMNLDDFDTAGISELFGHDTFEIENTILAAANLLHE
jgi:hypothetical protein